MIPAIWLCAGVVLITAEMVSGALVLLMLGAAALLTAAASGLGVPVGPDVAVFAAAAVFLVLLVRPALGRRLWAPAAVNTGPRGLLGAPGEVVETIEPGPEAVGTVRIAGAVWSARSLHGDLALPRGSPVTVVEITGATAVVTAARTPPATPSSAETGGT